MWCRCWEEGPASPWWTRQEAVGHQVGFNGKSPRPPPQPCRPGLAECLPGLKRGAEAELGSPDVGIAGLSSLRPGFGVVWKPLGRTLSAASGMALARSHLLKGDVTGSPGSQGPVVTQL